MFSICIFLSFFAQIRKKAEQDLLIAPRRPAAAAVHILWCIALLLRNDTPYVVSLRIPQGRLLHAGKARFAYSLTVVHFRKSVNMKEIGS